MIYLRIKHINQVSASVMHFTVFDVCKRILNAYTCSIRIANADGRVEFSSHRMLFCSTIDFRTPSELFLEKSSRPSSRGTVFFSMFIKDISGRWKS